MIETNHYINIFNFLYIIVDLNKLNKQLLLNCQNVAFINSNVHVLLYPKSSNLSLAIIEMSVKQQKKVFKL